MRGGGKLEWGARKTRDALVPESCENSDISFPFRNALVPGQNQNAEGGWKIRMELNFERPENGPNIAKTRRQNSASKKMLPRTSICDFEGPSKALKPPNSRRCFPAVSKPGILRKTRARKTREFVSDISFHFVMRWFLNHAKTAIFRFHFVTRWFLEKIRMRRGGGKLEWS